MPVHKAHVWTKNDNICQNCGARVYEVVTHKSLKSCNPAAVKALREEKANAAALHDAVKRMR